MFCFNFGYCFCKIFFYDFVVILYILFDKFFEFKYDIFLGVVEFFGNGYEIVGDINFFDKRFVE